MKVLNDPAAMRGLLLTYTEKVIALEETVSVQKPKVNAYDRISNSDGYSNITTAAKTLQMRPKDLFGFLSRNGWIYRRAGGKSWVGYQDKIQTGYLIHKVTTIPTIDGFEKTYEHLVTPKRLTKLAILTDNDLLFGNL